MDYVRISICMTPAERNQRLELIRKRCVEARGEEMYWTTPIWGGVFRSERSPGLADVLLASTKTYGYWDRLRKDLPSLQYDALMGFIIVAIEPDESEYRDFTKVKWNLRNDSIEDQSDQTILFLSDLLSPHDD